MHVFMYFLHFSAYFFLHEIVVGKGLLDLYLHVHISAVAVTETVLVSSCSVAR